VNPHIELDDTDLGWIAKATCWHGPRFGGISCNTTIMGGAFEDMYDALGSFQREMMHHLVQLHNGVSDPNAESRLQSFKRAARSSNKGHSATAQQAAQEA